MTDEHNPKPNQKHETEPNTTRGAFALVIHRARGVRLVVLCRRLGGGTAIPKPDGKPADMTKPVQVFILLGQSNMVGLGKITGGEGSLEIAVKEKKKYPYLVDDAGAWTERKDVRFVRDDVRARGRMSTTNG